MRSATERFSAEKESRRAITLHNPRKELHSSSAQSASAILELFDIFWLQPNNPVTPLSPFHVKSTMRSLYTGGMSQWSIAVCIALLMPFVVQAADSSLSFATTPLWLSSSHIMEGRSVHISTVVMKTGNDSISGTIIFYADTLAIGSAAFSLPAASVLTVDADANHNGISDAKEPQSSGSASAGNAPTHPQVAGVSTTTDATSTASDLIAGATQSAQSLGSALYKKTEQFRAMGADYSKKKLATAEYTEATTPSMWSWGEIKIMGLKTLSFFFDNIYAFYIVLIFIVLWLIRKVWRRYSLD